MSMALGAKGSGQAGYVPPEPTFQKREAAHARGRPTVLVRRQITMTVCGYESGNPSK
jgi:hypothetical protein